MILKYNIIIAHHLITKIKVQTIFTLRLVFENNQLKGSILCHTEPAKYLSFQKNQNLPIWQIVIVLASYFVIIRFFAGSV